MAFNDLALWLLVISLGIQTGAGLFETRVLVPLWASSPPQSVLAYLAVTIRPDSGHRLWIFLTPLTGIISLLNLVAALLYAGPARTWWLFAASSALLVIIVTFAYFIPVLLRLPDAAKMPAAQLTRMVRLWVRLNWLRFAILVAAWLAGLKAFAIALA
jgi:hypothetical protein